MLALGSLQVWEDYIGAVKAQGVLKGVWTLFRSIFLQQQSAAFRGELASLKNVTAMERHWHSADWRAMEQSIHHRCESERVRPLTRDLRACWHSPCAGDYCVTCALTPWGPCTPAELITCKACMLHMCASGSTEDSHLDYDVMMLECLAAAQEADPKANGARGGAESEAAKRSAWMHR